MCGIIGFLGKSDAVNNVLDGLTKLEYRGYDSAGLAYIDDGSVHAVKSVGNADQLIEKMNNVNPPKDRSLAIGHTRWATHGGATELNAHPHLSNNGKIAVVHNGIIENYLELIEFLAGYNIKMQTETDTEVIPNLIQIYYDGDLKKATQKAIKHLKGSYAILALAAESPNTLVCAKHGMPLCIGAGKDFSYVTSDIPTALSKTDDIYVIENGELVVMEQGSIKFFQGSKIVEKELIKPPHTRELITKGPFKTYMEKEINDIPEVFQRIITYYNKNSSPVTHELLDILLNAATIHICACGSAYNAGLVIGNLIEKHARIRVKNHIASEFRYNDPLFTPTDVGIVISQSGETADTIAAMNLMKENSIPVIAICNTNNSSIEREANFHLPMLAGFEIAVASTKAYCAQVLIGAILVNSICGSISRQNADLSDKPPFSKNAFSLLPMHARQVILKNKDIAALALKRQSISRIFFLGIGLDAVAAQEAAMKVKELSYIHCEGYPAGELKHGALSLVDNNTLTALFQTSDALGSRIPNAPSVVAAKIANAAAEVKARGSKIWNVEIPDSPLSFCYSVMPAQLFALHLSKLKGNNPDKPRHLAKAVTVG